MSRTNRINVQRTFAETSGDGAYTADVAVPAGAKVIDVQFASTHLWTAGTSASLKVGDSGNDDGYIEATNLKVAPVVKINGVVSVHRNVGEIGVYTVPKTYDEADTITAVITKVGVGAGGRSTLTVMMLEPSSPIAIAKVDD